MFKTLFVIFLILTSFTNVNGQTTYIDSLKKKKTALIAKIQLLEDSVKYINSKIKSSGLKLNSKEEHTVIIGVCNSNAVFRLNPNPLAIIIDTLKINQRVNVVDYFEGYFGTNIGNQYGYINEVWLTNSDSLNEFKESIINRRLVLSNKLKEEEYIRKYGSSNYKKIKNGEYWIGMKDEMTIIALGKPSQINRTVGSWGVHEQWVYETNELYLYFENGILTSFQNKL